ncbi:hypothetical protein BT67DRAFT_40954 [Trichocladium antarcticum]|uniref:DUF8035 domain-containing protein n=1 Tax=Trichocladium antarcticum TaxID=1450529 RepID=A0AAN6UIX6_9PEZI|nr:hypothetical protein BT67DRAFT_40954 [Trichocladium antarcticum]
MAYRSSAPDLARPDGAQRWDRSRYEQERERDRYEDIRERFEDDDDDDHVYSRGPPSRRDGPPPSERRFRPRDLENDEFIRERRRVVYDDESPPPRRRRSPSGMHRRPLSPVGSEAARSVYRRPSPPESEAARSRHRRPSPPGESEFSRSRVTLERERYRSPSPAPIPRRPAQMLRRQSSLDTFDRPKRYWEHEEYGVPARREEYGPPARRDDYRAPPYVDIPLPRSKALPPPRVYAEREFFDEIQVSDPHRHGDEDFHPAGPERVREKEVIRTRRRARSRESRATSRRGRSRSRSRSSSRSSSSESGGTTLTSKSEYPKKGKTRIPGRLVSKRALIDLGYPFVEEGTTIVVQKALGQQNIDDLLKLSDDYKKSELELHAARSSAGDVIEERIEHRTEIIETGPPAPAAAPPPSSGPVVIVAEPPPPPVEVVKTTVIRDVSPARTYTNASYDSHSSYDTYDSVSTAGPIIYDAHAPREMSSHVPVGPVALIASDPHRRHHSHHRHGSSRSRHRHGSSRSRHRRGSRHDDDLRSEIYHLEKQLARRRSCSRGGELVRAERLSTGELVLYEEETELVQEPVRAGTRIERDRRGRLAISVPRYRRS